MHNFGVRRFNNLTKVHLWCHKACLRRKYFLGSVRSLELVGTLGTLGTLGTDGTDGTNGTGVWFPDFG